MHSSQMSDWRRPIARPLWLKNHVPTLLTKHLRKYLKYHGFVHIPKSRFPTRTFSTFDMIVVTVSSPVDHAFYIVLTQSQIRVCICTRRFRVACRAWQKTVSTRSIITTDFLLLQTGILCNHVLVLQNTKCAPSNFFLYLARSLTSSLSLA